MFNTLRAGVIWSAVAPSPGRHDEAYLDDIDKTVSILAKHGIWWLLDFQQDA